jgi:hypothetical protein
MLPLEYKRRGEDIQGVSRRIVNILGDDSMEYSE